MRAEDITPQTSLATSEQAEAVDNIVGANLYQISPDAFRESKTELSPEVKRLNLPPVATPVVARNIAQSPDHAGAIAPDSEELSWIEDNWNKFTTGMKDMFSRQGELELQKAEAYKQGSQYVGEQIPKQVGATLNEIDRKIGPEQRMNELNWKKLRRGQFGADEFTEDDDIELMGLNLAKKDDFGRKDYGLTFAESLPSKVVAQGVDMAAIVGRNKKLIGSIVGGTTLATTGVGAAVGSIGGGVGALPGAATGFGIGLKGSIIPAYVAASFVDSYVNTAASVYGDLDQAVGPDGTPLRIDETNKKYISHGVGIVSGTLSAVTDKLMLDSVPWVKNILNPKNITDIIVSPARSKSKEMLIAMGKTMMTNGAEEMLQEYAQVIGEEVGNSYNGTEVSFWTGMDNAWEKLKKDPRVQARIGEAGVVGALSAGAVTVGSQAAVDTGVAVVNAAADKVTKLRKKPETFVQYRARLLTDPNTKYRVPETDIVDSVGNDKDQAVEVLNFQTLLDASSEVAKATNLHNLDSEQVLGMRSEMLIDNGIKYLWLDKEELTKFANDEQKALAIRNIIDESGTAAAALNAPIRVSAHEFLRLHDQYPEISEFARLRAEGPSPNSARVWFEAKEKADQQRAEVREKLKLGEKSPEERANAVKVTPDVDDETLTEAIGTQEVADAYLNRLDLNEVEAKEKVVFSGDPTQINGTTRTIRGKRNGESYTLEIVPVDTDNSNVGISQIQVVAYDSKGKQIGSVQGDDHHIQQESDKGKYQTTDVFVDEAHRRQGIATEMYDLLRDKGVQLAEKGGYRNDDGIKFREDYDKTLSEVSPGAKKKLEEIAQMRERVKALRERLPKDQGAKAVLEQALNTPQPVNDVFGEADYINQPVFNEVIESVIGDKELDKIINAQKEARTSVVDSIHESAEHEMNKVRSVLTQIAVSVQEQTEAAKVENDPNIAVVEKFLSSDPNFSATPRYSNVEDLSAPHHKPGRSIYSIDPNLLSDAQKKKYLKDPILRKRKVFAKGGMSPDNAGLAIGVNNGENLLRILSTAPTKQEAISAGVDKSKARINNEVNESVDLDQTNIRKAIHREADAHLNELKYMLTHKWATMAKTLVRAGTDVKRIDEVTQRARKTILQTKFSDLNANQFKVGARKSQRLAMKAAVKNDTIGYAANKEAVALNIELSGETHVAIGKVNRVIKFAKRFNTPEVQQELKDAGPSFVAAVDELLDVFNLNPSKKDQSIRGSYQKWVEKQIKLGLGNFEISERLSDVRESINDMTVEEILVIGNRLKTILHSAKIENQMQNQFGDPAKDLQTFENLKVKLHAESQAHPEYDINRSVKSQGKMSLESALSGFRDMAAMIKNIEHILLNADNGKVGGLYNETILAALKGVGRYAGQGEQGKNTDMAALSKRFDKIVESYGLADWNKLQNTKIFVKEWENNKKLNFGHMTKGQLFMMLLNGGNAGNSQRMAENFTVYDAEGNIVSATDIETIRAVLERHLDERDAVAAQRIMDLYASYFPRVEKLHEDMSGVKPDMVEAVPFQFKNKMYPGGYYHLNYDSEMSLDRMTKRAAEATAKADGDNKFNLSDRFYTDDMTRHGHTEKRTSNNNPINLSMDSIGMGFEMILHDLNFRKPIADAMKIVLDPQVSKDLAATVGLADLNVVINSIVDAAASVQMENAALFSSAKVFERIAAHTRAGLSTAYLVGNAASVFIQPVSLIYAVERMESSSSSKGAATKHLLVVMGQIGQNFGSWQQFSDFAAEINPSVEANREGIDDNARDILRKKMPKKNYNSKTGAVDAFRELVNEAGYKVLGGVDQLQKIVVSIAAYRQFVEGDVEGYSYEQVMAMTPEERDHQAKVYASSVARLTLTAGSQLDKAPIQKHLPFKSLTMFFNDARNALNNTLRIGREGRQAFKANDYGKTATQATKAMLILGLTKIMSDMLRGNWDKIPLFDENEYEPEELALEMTKYLAMSPYDVTLGNIPVVRDIKFGLDSAVFKRNQEVIVQSPMVKAMSDIGTTVQVMMQTMDLIDGERELSAKQIKALGFTASYVTGGLPINAVLKVYKHLEDINPSEIFTSSLFEDFSKRLEKFKETQAELPVEEQIPEEAMKALDDVQLQIAPPVPTETAALDMKRTLATIMQIESGGNVFAKNPNSSAAGLYQFTDDTWEDVMRRAPELGLTANGRVSANPAQQEKAMLWFTRQNARTLRQGGIPITTENIYAAHFLGARKAVEVLGAPATMKLKMLISAEAMAANDFKNSMKVRDFKTWVAKKVDSVSGEVAALDKQNP